MMIFIGLNTKPGCRIEEAEREYALLAGRLRAQYRTEVSIRLREAAKRYYDFMKRYPSVRTQLAVVLEDERRYAESEARIACNTSERRLDWLVDERLAVNHRLMAVLREADPLADWTGFDEELNDWLVEDASAHFRLASFGWLVSMRIDEAYKLLRNGRGADAYLVASDALLFMKGRSMELDAMLTNPRYLPLVEPR